MSYQPHHFPDGYPAELMYPPPPGHHHHHHQQYHQHQNFHQHHPGAHHHSHRYPPPPGFYPPQPYHPYHGQPYYPYGQLPYQGEAPPSYPPVSGSSPQTRSSENRKGLSIVDPKEKELQKAEANGVAPPQPAKKAVLPIKDPLTKLPISIDQVAPSSASPQSPAPEHGPPQQSAVPTPAPVFQPQPSTAAAITSGNSGNGNGNPKKKNVIPILDPVTRKEVTAKGGSTSSTTAASELEPPSSSSSATPAPSTPRSVVNSEDAAQPSEDSSQPKPATPPSEKPSYPKPAHSQTEDLVFAPGAKWGLPTLPRPEEAESSAPKAPGMALPSLQDSASHASRPSTRPDSRSGRRVYDFEFLLSIAEKAPPPPENLKEYEVYAPNARQHRMSESSSDAKLDKRDRRGYGTKTSPTSSGKGGYDDLRNKFGKSFVPGPPGFSKAATFEQLTNRIDNAFNVNNARAVMSLEQRVLKKVRGILNKVTPEKYDVLFEELWQHLYAEKQLDISGIIEQVIHTVFDVALDQPKFSNLYADICFHLCRKIQTLKKEELNREESQDMSRSDSTTEDASKTSTLKEFRRILLNTCQARFEEGSKHQQTIIPHDADPDEVGRIQKLEHRYKARSLGNITFVAELFKRSLLSERIMHIIIKTLLMDTDHSDPRNVESMETLCEMLNAVGKKLDRTQVKPAMDVYFEKLEEIALQHPVKRICFLVLNMVELRKANWVTRQDLKQTQDEDVRRSSSLRTPSWSGSGPPAEAPPRQPLYNVARNPSLKEPPAKEAPKEKERLDKDGFQLVGRTKAVEKSPSSHQPPSQQKTPQSPVQVAPKPKTPTTPHSGPTAEADSSVSPVARPIPDLSDESIARKARGLLEEWAADPTNTENAIVVLKEEIPNAAYSQFLMGLVLCAISHNKREQERAQLPGLLGLYAENELITKQHLHDAFLAVLQKALREQMWVDVPRLWGNTGQVICTSIKEDLADLEVVVPMCEALTGDEEYPDLPVAFMKGVTEAMKEEDMDVFEPQKATAILHSFTKKRIKKAKKSPTVDTIEEFESALEKILGLPT